MTMLLLDAGAAGFAPSDGWRGVGGARRRAALAEATTDAPLTPPWERRIGLRLGEAEAEAEEAEEDEGRDARRWRGTRLEGLPEDEVCLGASPQKQPTPQVCE